MKNWSEINGRSGNNPHVGKYIGIYFAFGIGNAALVVMQTLILWIFCSIEVSPFPFGCTVPVHRQGQRESTKALVFSRTCIRARHTLARTNFAGSKLLESLADLAVMIVTDSRYRLRESYTRGWLMLFSAAQ